MSCRGSLHDFVNQINFFYNSVNIYVPPLPSLLVTTLPVSSLVRISISLSLSLSLLFWIGNVIFFLDLRSRLEALTVSDWRYLIGSRHFSGGEFCVPDRSDLNLWLLRKCRRFTQESSLPSRMMRRRASMVTFARYHHPVSSILNRFVML